MPNEPTTTEHRIPIGFTDLRAAIRHDANIARREGFPNVAMRAENILAALDKADDLLRDQRITSYKVEIVITPNPINEGPT